MFHECIRFSSTKGRNKGKLKFHFINTANVEKTIAANRNRSNFNTISNAITSICAKLRITDHFQSSSTKTCDKTSKSFTNATTTTIYAAATNDTVMLQSA